MKRFFSWWRRRREERASLRASQNRFIQRAENQSALDDKILQAIETGNLSLAKELQGIRDTLPCPWCGRIK